MTVFGGKRGYLVNTRDICAHTTFVGVSFVGQNGATRSQKLPVKGACGKANGRRKKDKRGGGGSR